MGAVRCLECNKIVPEQEFDSFGRINPKTACFCRDTDCYQIWYRKQPKRKDVQRKYYLAHPEKFKKKQ